MAVAVSVARDLAAKEPVDDDEVHRGQQDSRIHQTKPMYSVWDPARARGMVMSRPAVPTVGSSTGKRPTTAPTIMVAR